MASSHQQGYARGLMQHQQALLVGFFQMIVSLVFLGNFNNGRHQNKFIKAKAAAPQEGDDTKKFSKPGDDVDANDQK